MARFLGVGRRLAVALSFCFSFAGASPHASIQAQVQTRTAPQHYLPGKRSTDARRAAAAPGSPTCEEVHANGVWGPLRIGYEFVDLSASPGVTQSSTQIIDFLMGEIMERAVLFYREALEVRQPTGPLLADWILDGCSSFTFDPEPVCSTVVHPACGSDGVLIPAQHLRSARTCTQRCSPLFNCIGDCTEGGQCNCDATAWEQQSGDYCCTIAAVQPDGCPDNCSVETASFFDVDGPPGTRPLCETCTTTVEGEGVTDADIQLYVTAIESVTCSSSEAYAAWCSKDQCDRPIFGHLNFCPSKLPTVAPGEWDDTLVRQWISVAIHEIAHALGFSSSLFRYFRNADGTPKIARDPNNPDVFANQVKWSCTSEGHAYPAPSGYSTHVDISPEILAVEAADGSAACECPLGGQTTMGQGCLISSNFPQVPSCNIFIKTPTVVREVREFFDCPSLTGARLENQDSQVCDIIGSHWDKRLFKDEVMEPGVGIHAFVSKVTLAVFEDSGWYRANFDKADQPTVGVTWGYKQGCSFVNQKCVDGGNTSTPSHFCTALGQQGCSLGLFERSVCDMQSYSWPSGVPAFLDFFNGDGHVGHYGRMDYCPTMRAFIGGVCTSEASSPRWELDGDRVNLNLEVYSPSSRCFEGDLMVSGYKQSWYPACYEARCREDGASYTLWVSSGQDSTTAAQLLGECTEAGQELLASSLPNEQAQGKVVCATPAVVCGSPLITHHLLGSTRTTTTQTATTSTATTSTATTSTATTSTATTSTASTNTGTETSTATETSLVETSTSLEDVEASTSPTSSARSTDPIVPSALSLFLLRMRL